MLLHILVLLFTKFKLHWIKTVGDERAEKSKQRAVTPLFISYFHIGFLLAIGSHISIYWLCHNRHVGIFGCRQ